MGKGPHLRGILCGHPDGCRLDAGGPALARARFRGRVPYCNTHYHRALRNGGDPGPPGLLHVRSDPGPCCVCGDAFYGSHKGRAYCSTHYSRVTRSPIGSPGPLDRIRRHAEACARCGGLFRRHVAGEPLCEPCSRVARYRLDPEGERARTRDYQKRHRERIAARRSVAKKRKRRQPGFRDRERAAQAAWRVRNRNKKRTQVTRRAERLGGFVPPETIRLVLADPCVYCGGSGESIDHIAPISLGGEHHWTNLAAACMRCNAQKRDKPLLMFLLTR